MALCTRYLTRLVVNFNGQANLSLPFGRLALLFLVLLHPVLLSSTNFNLALSKLGWTASPIMDSSYIPSLRLLLLPTFAPMTASFLQGQRPHEILFWGFPFLLLLLVILQREEEEATQVRLERLKGLKYRLKGA